MKRTVKLTESDFHSLIKESIKTILKESTEKNGYVSDIMGTINFDEILNNGGTCITSDMFTGESFDIETNFGKAVGELYITYNGQEYSPKIKFVWTGEALDDVRHAAYKALGTLDTDVLEKMATGKLWDNENHSELNETISRAIRKVLREGFDPEEIVTDGSVSEEMSPMEKGQRIIEDLKKLNFEQRGHEIEAYLDEEPAEISVTNINVPMVSDCRAIADKYGVDFYTEDSFGMGIFEIY